MLSPYLKDGIVLKKGSVDENGARIRGKNQNVPDGYVTDLQNDLITLGYNIVGSADGSFGRNTEKAVKLLQDDEYIVADGIVDFVTKDGIITNLQDKGVLTYLTDDSVILQMGNVDAKGAVQYPDEPDYSPGSYVHDLQNDLKSFGFDKIVADGFFWDVTKGAVQSIQREGHLDETGKVTQATKELIVQKKKTNNPQHTDNNIIKLSPRVQHFCQADIRWGKETLNDKLNNLTMKNAGCAVTCVAMILNFYGRKVTPKTLDSYLDSNKYGYDGNGIGWGIAAKHKQTNTGVKLKLAMHGSGEHYITGSTDKLRKILSKRVDENLPTVVSVGYGHIKKHRHFVVCVGKTPDGEFIMNDPGTSEGDGYKTLENNIIEETKRHDGYTILRLLYYIV